MGYYRPDNVHPGSVVVFQPEDTSFLPVIALVKSSDNAGLELDIDGSYAFINYNQIIHMYLPCEATLNLVAMKQQG